MLEKSNSKRIVAGMSAIALAVMLGAPALAQPPVNVQAGRFEGGAEKRAKAYRMKEGFKSAADAKALGEKLNRAARVSDQVDLKGDDKSNALLHVSKADPSAHFRVDKTTGDFSFQKGMKSYFNERATQGLVTKERAPDAAKKYLSDLGLMPEKQEELVVRHVGGVRQIDLAAEGQPGQEMDKWVTVHFGRQIDGVDVGGPGSKIIVDLGANGELVGLHHRWVEVTAEEKGPADFKGQSEVVNDIKAKMRGEGAKAKRIDAAAPDFGYYDDGKGNIEPAYFFEADLTYDLVDVEGKKAEHKEKYHGVVPALKGSKADFAQEEKAGKPPGRVAAPPAQDRAPIND